MYINLFHLFHSVHHILTKRAKVGTIDTGNISQTAKLLAHYLSEKKLHILKPCGSQSHQNMMTANKYTN